MIKHCYIGAHVPSQGGLEHIFGHARTLDIAYLQCFTKNNRQWHFEEFTEDQVARYEEAKKNSNVHMVFSHACYLINLASEKKEVVEKSVRGLQAELRRCDQIGIPWAVVHPGSCGDCDERESSAVIAQHMKHVLKITSGDAGILLENSSGQGSSIPYTVELLGELFHAIKKDGEKRIGVCIDTCHAFAAGYDFSNQEKYHEFWSLVEKHIGISHVKVIHTNDSMKECGSRVDRHAHIEKGKMGKAFSLLMQDKRLAHIPKILETPYDDVKDLVPDIEILKKYCS